MNLVAYLLGVLAHVVGKWADWKRSKPDVGWFRYWRAEGLLNVSGGIAAIVCFGLWEAGWIGAVFEKAFELGSAALGAGVEVGELPVNGWTSFGAGYVFDSLARRLLSRIERIGGPGA